MPKLNGFLGDSANNEVKYPCRTIDSPNILVSITRESEVKNRGQNWKVDGQNT